MRARRRSSCRTRKNIIRRRYIIPQLSLRAETNGFEVKYLQHPGKRSKRLSGAVNPVCHSEFPPEYPLGLDVEPEGCPECGCSCEHEEVEEEEVV